MYLHIVPISHYWPGVNPATVWQLPYDMWLLYLQALKDLREEQKRQNNESG